MAYRMSADWKQMYNLQGKNVLADTDDPTGDWTEKYIPEAERPLVWHTIAQAIETKSIFELEHRVFQVDGSIGWVYSKAVPVFNPDGHITQWIGAGNDITERKQAEVSLHESEKRLKTVLDGIGEAFYVLDDEFRFLFASGAALDIWRKKSEDVFGQAFLEIFPEAAGSEVYEAHWQVVQTGTAKRFETISPVLNRWVDVKMERTDQGGLSVSFWDIEYRKQAEIALRESEARYRSLFNGIDEGFCILELIYSDHGEAVDWIYREANPAFERQTGYIDPVGKRISDIQPNLERSWFEKFAEVARSGQPLRFVQYTEAMQIWYDVYAMPLGLPGDKRVSLLFTNITERRKEEERQAAELMDIQQLQQISSQLIQEDNMEALYLELVDAALAIMHSGAASLQMYIRDKAALLLLAYKGFAPESAAFWKWVNLESNSTCAGTLNLQQRFLVTDVETSEFMRGTADLDAYRQSDIRSVQSTPLVSRKGNVVGIMSTHCPEVYSPTERELRLFDVLARQAADLIERKLAEEKMRESEERLQLAIIGADIFTWEVNPETNHTSYSSNFNEVIGFEISEISEENYVHIHPDDEAFVLQATYDALSGKAPLNIEHRVINPRNKEVIWVKVQGRLVSKAGGKAAFIVITQNINTQKLAEEVLKNYNVRLEKEAADRTAELREQYALQQTMLDTTLIGMSVFAPVRNAQNKISDFRIVTVNKKIERASGRSDMVGKLYSELFPGIKEMGLFEVMVKTVETGDPQKMEYHYTYDGIDRWYSTMFVKGDDFLVSTNLDITDRKASEERLRKIEEAQQLEIFRVTLRTQEVERRRISESLHNGLGQLLYGIKMSLTQLKAEKALSNRQQYEEDRHYTSQLLSEAIRDTRRISRELTPQILEEFGLEAAIKDVCKQMQDGVTFHCRVELNNHALDKYLQLAVFRTLQELMINVLKHAGATRSDTLVRAKAGQILIRVKDDGRGLEETTGKDGIGLASIRSKVDLLNGTFKIDSAPDKGTTISIHLPFSD